MDYFTIVIYPKNSSNTSLKHGKVLVGSSDANLVLSKLVDVDFETHVPELIIGDSVYVLGQYEKSDYSEQMKTVIPALSALQESLGKFFESAPTCHGQCGICDGTCNR